MGSRQPPRDTNPGWPPPERPEPDVLPTLSVIPLHSPQHHVFLTLIEQIQALEGTLATSQNLLQERETLLNISSEMYAQCRTRLTQSERLLRRSGKEQANLRADLTKLMKAATSFSAAKVAEANTQRETVTTAKRRVQAAEAQLTAWKRLATTKPPPSAPWGRRRSASGPR